MKPIFICISFRLLIPIFSAVSWRVGNVLAGADYLGSSHLLVLLVNTSCTVQGWSVDLRSAQFSVAFYLQTSSNTRVWICVRKCSDGQVMHSDKQTDTQSDSSSYRGFSNGNEAHTHKKDKKSKLINSRPNESVSQSACQLVGCLLGFFLTFFFFLFPSRIFFFPFPPSVYPI